ncbi:MAG: hypothetical protein WCF36_14125 [Candidatus Nanopelagicales bacterium]
MGDLEYEEEHRLLMGRRAFVMFTLALVAALVGAGAWINAQAPTAVALAAVPAPSASASAAAEPGLALVARGADSEALTSRLAVAAGRSMDSLAQRQPGEVVNPLESEAPTVAGAQAANGEYADTIAALEEAEAAAAEALSQTSDSLTIAEEERTKAAADLAGEEAAAAREIDRAIDTAIAAARAKDAYTVPLGGAGSGGASPVGESTSTAEVLGFVRKYFPANQVGNAMAVSRCESGHGNRVSKPNSNGTRDFGVFQINDGGTLQAALRSIDVRFSGIEQARTKALNTETNVRMAKAIWSSRGWQPWTCAAKIKVVAGLYQRAPGPMDGKYDDYGRAR